MSDLFLNILNMSIAASWLILAVVLLRFLLKKAPKWIAVLLWGIVALRLVVPFSFESALSLIPSAETFNAHNIQYETPAISSGIPAVNNAVNPVLGETFAPNPAHWYRRHAALCSHQLCAGTPERCGKSTL